MFEVSDDYFPIPGLLERFLKTVNEQLKRLFEIREVIDSLDVEIITMKGRTKANQTDATTLRD